MNKKPGFTLLEIIIVLIIVAILSALAVPTFVKTKERALDKEAQTALRLIQAAEKIYRVKRDEYYPNGGNADQAQTNSGLQLDLSSQYWQYGITTATVAAFSSTAMRVNNIPPGWNRNWTITEGTDPQCTGSVNCP